MRLRLASMEGRHEAKELEALHQEKVTAKDGKFVDPSNNEQAVSVLDEGNALSRLVAPSGGANARHDRYLGCCQA